MWLTSGFRCTASHLRVRGRALRESVHARRGLRSVLAQASEAAGIPRSVRAGRRWREDQPLPGVALRQRRMNDRVHCTATRRRGRARVQRGPVAVPDVRSVDMQLAVQTEAESRHLPAVMHTKHCPPRTVLASSRPACRAVSGRGLPQRFGHGLRFPLSKFPPRTVSKSTPASHPMGVR